MAIAWQGDIELKITELDAQHEQLISLFYDLQQAIVGNKTGEKIEEIIEDISSYAQYHFSTEKNYFERFDYPGSDRHIKEHEKFSDKITAIKDNVKNNELKTSLLLIKYLERWINDHIITEDKKFSDHFHRLGSS
jgi:hemerythrin-like metal-binding protein